MKSNIIVLPSHRLQLLIMTSTLVFALCFVQPQLTRAGNAEDAAQAAEAIDKANQEAEANIPNGTVKPDEDALDAAARANDDTPNAANAAAEKAAEAKADATGAPFKANNNDQGKIDKYREALKKRREARKKLKKALAGLRQELQNLRSAPTSGEESDDITKKKKQISEADKALKESEKVPQRPKPKTAENAAQPTTGETCAALIATGKIKVETSGTGETIGHVADLKIQNLTDQPLTCAVPPMILESGSGKNQHYACPSGQTMALNPHQTKTVPMNGVCLNRNKPPVAKGVSGDLVMNEANPTASQNPNSHIPPAQARDLLRICTAKYEAADKLQKDGALKDLPYKGKQKQKDIVVQWSTWCDPRISQITGAPPATKDDLKKVVYKQLESKKPMSPDTKKKVDQGIDIIFEKVELTTAKAKDLEKPGAFFEAPVSTEKPGPFFKPATEAKPATAAQPGVVGHVEDKPRGGNGHWAVKVKLPSGEIVEVWFETDEPPALEFCNNIKINKTHTSSYGHTVVDDYVKNPSPTPTATAVPRPTPTATSAATSTPTPTATQTPQSLGGKTEAEKPKEEGVKPAEPEKPKEEAKEPCEPLDLPPWLKPWWKAVKPVWEGVKTGTGMVPTDLPGGKDALGGIIARLNKKIADDMANGKDTQCYEDLRDVLVKIFNSMKDED